MFSNLGDQFVQFTNALSLDNMQTEQEKQGAEGQQINTGDCVLRKEDQDEDNGLNCNEKELAVQLQFERDRNAKLIENYKKTNAELEALKCSYETKLSNLSTQYNLLEQQLSKCQETTFQKDNSIAKLEEKLRDCQKNYEKVMRKDQTNESEQVATITRTFEEQLSQERSEVARLTTALESTREAMSNESEQVATITRTFEEQLSQERSEVARLTTALESTREAMLLERERFDSVKLSLEDDIVCLRQELATEKYNFDEMRCSQQAKLDAIEAINASLKLTLEDKSKLYSDLLSEQTAFKMDEDEKVEQLRNSLSDKDALIADLEGKLNTLSSKTKEVMQKLKSKSVASEADFEKLQSKESELLALRMKFENVDRSLSDARLKNTELNERLLDAAGEANSLKESLSESTDLCEALKNQNTELTRKIEAVEEEKIDLNTQLLDLKEKYSSRVSEAEEQHRTSILNLQEKIDEQGKQILELQSELARTASRVKSDGDSSRELENYKKRAQLALKKANSSVSQLTGELEQARKLSIDAENRRIEGDSLLANCQTLLEKSQALLSEKCIELERLQGDLSQANERTNFLEQELQSMKQLLEQFENNVRSEQEVTASSNTTRLTERDEPSAVVHLPSNADNSEGNELRNNEALNGREHEMDRDDINPPSVEWSASWAKVAARSIAESCSLSDEPEQESLKTIINAKENANAEGQQLTEFSHVASSEAILLIRVLQKQAEINKKELSQRGIALEAAYQELREEKEEKSKLRERVEELMAFLERTKELRDGPDSAINMEYLKNCVFKYMTTNEHSERRRLYPVICTILKLTAQEMAAVEHAIVGSEMVEYELDSTLNTLSSFAGGLLGSIYGTYSDASNGSRQNP